MTYSVPDGLMKRLEFTDEPVAASDIPPRIPADLPVLFSPAEEGEAG